MNRRLFNKISIAAIIVFPFLQCADTVNESNEMKLEQEIPLPNVSGRIDHIAINVVRQIAYVAALGNNSVEVVDLKNGRVIHSIKNLSEPQGIVYITKSNSIFVTDGGDGKCIVFDATDFQQTHSLKLSSDADNVRYDSSNNKIFVGYGSGGIALIDANTFKQTGNVSLTGHPESFQLNSAKQKLFVNVPDEHEVDAVDLNTSSVIARWKPEALSNFPMAIDEKNHRLFIGCRSPAKLEILDSENGKAIASLNCSGDADDVFFNESKKEIYVSAGEGSIFIYKQNDADHYELAGQVSTRSGARTSLFVPELNELLVAAPASPGKSAALLVYSIH